MTYRERLLAVLASRAILCAAGEHARLMLRMLDERERQEALQGPWLPECGTISGRVDRR